MGKFSKPREKVRGDGWNSGAGGISTKKIANVVNGIPKMATGIM